MITIVCLKVLHVGLNFFLFYLFGDQLDGRLAFPILSF